jgi:hypothetical protein
MELGNKMLQMNSDIINEIGDNIKVFIKQTGGSIMFQIFEEIKDMKMLQAEIVVNRNVTERVIDGRQAKTLVESWKMYQDDRFFKARLNKNASPREVWL